MVRCCMKLTDYQIQRRQELTKKLAEKTITKYERIELRDILILEMKIAIDKNDLLALFCIVFLRTLLDVCTD